MRAQPQPDQATSLLIQKQVPYAELGEMARIAINVLQDDGWKVDRVGASLSVDFTVTATPIETPGVIAQASAEIESARKNFERLRIEVDRELRSARDDHWMYVLIGVGSYALLAAFRLQVWAPVLIAGCFAAYVARRVMANRKSKGVA